MQALELGVIVCGPSMVFTNPVNPRSHIRRKHEYRRMLAKRGASIGANAVIVYGGNPWALQLYRCGCGGVVPKTYSTVQ